MKVTGIIAEYNPFHNGHAYHLQKSLECSGADHAVIVMSGDFVQRGAPAIVSKYLRANSALQAGASVVVQLPVRYSVGSAEHFARGAVSMLHALGCVDTVCFGSESGSLSGLSKRADILALEPDSYKDALRQNLRLGLSFPLASEKALLSLSEESHISDACSKPNDILGALYIKAINELNSPIQPIPIPRKCSGHHDRELNSGFSSATSIRSAIAQKDFRTYADQMPSYASTLLGKSLGIRCPVVSDDFSILLKYRLLTETAYSLTDYMDIDEDLANRIMNNLEFFSSFTQFTDLIKTKNLTYTRISRAFFHILLDIRKTECDQSAMDTCSYAQILGFRKDQAHVLRAMKNLATVPLITKQTHLLPEPAGQMFRQDMSSSEIYESIVAHKFSRPYSNPFRHPLEVV